MSDARRAVSVVALVVVVLVGVGLALWLVPWGSTAPEVPASEAPEDEAPISKPAPEPRRVAIPRPQPSPDPASATGVERSELQDEVRSESDPPEDTGSESVPELIGAGPELGTALQSAIGAQKGPLIDCLADWQRYEPDALSGQVAFHFGMDDQGVQSIDVLDVDTIPDPVLDCLGDVLWDEVEWPATVEPIDVTWPIEVSVRPDDEGEEP